MSVDLAQRVLLQVVVVARFSAGGTGNRRGLIYWERDEYTLGIDDRCAHNSWLYWIHMSIVQVPSDLFCLLSEPTGYQSGSMSVQVRKR